MAMKVNPPKAHVIHCHPCENGAGWDRPHEHIIGVIRCAEGDMDAWNDAVRWPVSYADLEEGEKPEPPGWRWWRWNPDPTGEYRGLLTEAKGPGRGNWMGALVVVMRS